MILCLDVGNTNIKYAVFDGNELVISFRVATEVKKTSDEYGGQLLTILSNNGVDHGDIKGGIISSVVPQLDYTLERMCSTYLGIKPLTLAPGLKTGLNLKVDNAREVGADRVVNNVAGLKKYGAPLIIIDFGTATTFNVLDKKGEFIDRGEDKENIVLYDFSRYDKDFLYENGEQKELYLEDLDVEYSQRSTKKIVRGEVKLGNIKKERKPFGTIIECGLLKAGDKLYDAKGDVCALIRSDGTLISTFGNGSIHQMGAVAQHAPACNGWMYWHYQNENKELVVIDELRKIVREELYPE